jgi:3-isopropylmalate dehydrogenase
MSHKIGLLPGDGIGPEVTQEALKVLAAVAAIDGFSYELVDYPYCPTA